MVFDRFTRKVREVGVRNTLKGICRKQWYAKLQKQYGFDEWHTSPYELRDYAQEVVSYVNEHTDPRSENDIVDIGCGLGEILRRIHAKNRIGLDYDRAALECAAMLDKSKTVRFLYGSFDEYGSGHTADYLITLGFTHGSDETPWIGPYRRITENNDIRHIIVDIFPEGADGAHHLDFTKILPAGYALEKRIGPLNGDKYVEIYTKQ